MLFLLCCSWCFLSARLLSAPSLTIIIIIYYHHHRYHHHYHRHHIISSIIIVIIIMYHVSSIIVIAITVIIIIHQPSSSSPTSFSRRPFRDTDDRWRCRALGVSVCSSASLRLMLFPQEQLGSLLYPSKPSIGLLSNLSSPFELDSQNRHILPQMHKLSYSRAPE